MSEPTPLERLKARYRAAAAAPPEHLEIPVKRAAAGELLVVYREPEWLAMQEDKIAAIASDDPRAVINMMATMLAKNVVDIKIRDGEQWLDGLGNGGPVNFHSAATALELQLGPDPETQPLTAVFAVLSSDWEVQRHGELLEKWEPQPVSSEVEATTVGESEPAG